MFPVILLIKALPQDWVWVSTFAARNYKFVPGDIVVYVSPKDPTDCLIKRVIGLEGDIISSDRYSNDIIALQSIRFTLNI